MKKQLVVLALVCLGLTGCMDLSMKISLEKNGSAKASFNLEMIEQLYQSLKFMLQQSGNDLSLMERGKLDQYLAERDGKLVEFIDKQENGMHRLFGKMDFADVRKWVGSSPGDIARMEKEGDLFVWYFLENPLGESLAGMDDEMLGQQLAVLMPQMAGMRVRFEFTVPELIETNLKTENANTAVFSLDFDEDIADKSPDQAIRAFRELLQSKWIKFKGLQ